MTSQRAVWVEVEDMHLLGDTLHIETELSRRKVEVVGSKPGMVLVVSNIPR